jgi:hypothetical protein
VSPVRFLAWEFVLKLCERRKSLVCAQKPSAISVKQNNDPLASPSNPDKRPAL